MNQQPPRLLCAKEVATILGVTERTAARLLRTGQIRGFKISAAVWRTTPQHVGEYIVREIERAEMRAQA